MSVEAEYPDLLTLCPKLYKEILYMLDDSADDYENIQSCVRSLEHCCQCRDVDCLRVSCHKMKSVVQHAKICKNRINESCPICKKLITVCCFHAKRCIQDPCLVPFCVIIRKKMAEVNQWMLHRIEMITRQRKEAVLARMGAVAPAASSTANIRSESYNNTSHSEDSIPSASSRSWMRPGNE